MKKNIYVTLTACLMAGVLAVGCSHVKPLMPATKISGYTQAQSMLVVDTERCKYEKLYTENVWQTVINASGLTYKDHMIFRVRTFLDKLKTMNILAESRNMELSNNERTLISQAANEYFNSLSDSDKKIMQATLEDVSVMYSEYCMANKVLSELTKDLNLEISDSEAKVIEINQIEFDDRETADRVLEILKEEGSSFTEQASIYSQNTVIAYKLGRGTAENGYETAAFALTKDEISDVVESDGKYYIIQCVNDYDANETAIHKEQLAAAKKNMAFEKIYDQFASEHEMEETPDWWNNIDFSEDNKTENGEFFNIYHKYLD